MSLSSVQVSSTKSTAPVTKLISLPYPTIKVVDSMSIASNPHAHTQLRGLRRATPRSRISQSILMRI